MCEGSFLPSSFGPHQKHTEFESSLRSYPINPFALFAKGGQSCGPYHDRHGLVADDSSLTSPTHRKPRWVGQPGSLLKSGRDNDDVQRQRPPKKNTRSPPLCARCASDQRERWHRLLC